MSDALPASPMDVELLDIEFHFQEKARNLLHMLLEAGIIVPEGEVTDCITPTMFIVDE